MPPINLGSELQYVILGIKKEYFLAGKPFSD